VRDLFGYFYIFDDSDLFVRIASIHYSEKEHTAKIGFEKRDATQTALMVSAAVC
jgi:hypothetical protein